MITSDVLAYHDREAARYLTNARAYRELVQSYAGQARKTGANMDSSIRGNRNLAREALRISREHRDMARVVRALARLAHVDG